ncbi:MAG: hypothetical protein H6719_10380 [Sandaracinaceae bacterium]|nr:hypothetical protein [Sandaracinaceae bacterium]
MDDRIDEILARLEALERRLDRLEDNDEPAGPRCSFCEEEKRIVDTIVRLTTESIVREMDARMEHGPPPGPPPPPPPDYGRHGQGPDGRGPRRR